MPEAPFPLADTHCHLDLMTPETLAAVAAKAPAAGVSSCFVPGVSLSSGSSSSRILENFKSSAVKIFFMLGVHPGYLQDFSEKDFQKQAELRRPFMIGEIGLDRRFEDRFSGAYQEQCLRSQLVIARESDIPVSLHIVGRHERALGIIREFPGIRGIVHGFSGSPELAREYLRSGFLIGIGPLVLNPACRKLRKAVAEIPPDLMVPETDAPFMFRNDGILKTPALPDLLPDIIRETAALQKRSHEETLKAVSRAIAGFLPEEEEKSPAVRSLTT